MDDDALEAKNSPQFSNPGTPRSEVDVRNTPPPGVPMLPVATPSQQQKQAVAAVAAAAAAMAQRAPQQLPQSKYAQLLAVIEDMGKDIRPTYSGSKSSAERLKRGIVHARILVRECLMECERSART
ncbi:cyclin-dependent kinase 2-associated protein 1-like [Lineus longissimus]|uniref:cyclin-dependent kinase 2-associated protein 1-like n=1 Tax=Lineus longissimus TaxID=88925 RepID=UPI00315CC9CD